MAAVADNRLRHVMRAGVAQSKMREQRREAEAEIRNGYYELFAAHLAARHDAYGRAEA